MTRVVYPSARLSANGARALLDTVDEGFRVCDLPSGRVRWELGPDAHVTLSASGTAVAWVAENGTFTILTDAGEARAALPVGRERVRAIAISDGGDRGAVLVAGDEDGGTGALVLFPGASGEDGIEETDLPVYDSGFVLANEDCSLLAVGSSSSVGEDRHSGLFVRNGHGLRPLWAEESAPLSHGTTALYGEWFFAANADGLAGWRRTGERMTIPGSMRERVIFSPDGSHLLAYRAEEVINVTSARMLFRLIDLRSLSEIRRVRHLIADRRGAQFALDGDLELFEVRVTRAAEIAVTTLAWSESAALPT
jgi:hypothetical protein